MPRDSDVAVLISLLYSLCFVILEYNQIHRTWTYWPHYQSRPMAAGCFFEVALETV
jgi:hypothetical protein